MSSANAQRLRLKQIPIDEWSIREKLSLASSVLRSGDQNWYSVSRTLKPFGEPNRPADWFSQKNCALQYSELLEKVETPKRKRGERGERGENTAEDLIVRELTQKRIDELKLLTNNEKSICQKLQQELELLKSSKATEELFNEMRERMKKEKQDKEIAEEEHKKWLVEREAKIALMKASRHNLLALRSPKTAKQAPVTSETNEEKPEATPNENENSQISEPLVVKIEDNVTLKDNFIEEDKDAQTQPSSTPSTSPLLTSLLQSPSPTTTRPLTGTNFNVLSPAGLKELQQRNSPCLSHVQFFAPSTVSSTSTCVQAPTVSLTCVSVSTSTTTVSSSSQVGSPANNEPASLTISSDKAAEMASLLTKVTPSSPVAGRAQNTSPTLCKLLEMPTDSSLKLPTSSESKEVVETQTESKDSKAKLLSEIASRTDKDEPMIFEQIETESTLDTKASLEGVKSESNQAHEDMNEENKVNKAENEKVETEIVPEKEIKKEPSEGKETEGSIDEEVKVKTESAQDAEEILGVNSELKTPEITPLSSRAKRKRPTTPVTTPTLTATRRSGRVRAIKDKTEEDQNVSVTNELPIIGAKKVHKEAPLEATFSEESTDASRTGVSKAASATDSSVPNSPASTSALIEDPESLKEHKAWKKSIMLLWRQAATHKFSTLFSHPVTDSEAQGYSTVVYRPMDLLTIRKKIENGTIKTTAEFQRDIMLMFQNAIMYNSVDHDVHQMAVEMQKEILEGIEDYIETQQQSSAVTTNESKTRGRRSNASSTPLLSTPTTTITTITSTTTSTTTTTATTTSTITSTSTSTTATVSATSTTSSTTSTTIDAQDSEANMASRRKSRTSSDAEPSTSTPSTTKSKTKKK